jgi:hypothetical protein
MPRFPIAGSAIIMDKSSPFVKAGGTMYICTLEYVQMYDLIVKHEKALKKANAWSRLLEHKQETPLVLQTLKHTWKECGFDHDINPPDHTIKCRCGGNWEVADSKTLSARPFHFDPSGLFFRF